MGGMNYDDLFPARFLKASLFQGRAVTLTMTDVSVQGLERDDGLEHEVPILAFAETKKGLVLNRTNGESIRAMFGDDIDAWIGKRVTLYPERDASGLSDSGLCIRVQGSPDIDKPIQASIKLPRRKPVARKLTVTTKGSAAAPDFDAAPGPVATPVADDPTDAELNEMFGAEGDAR